MQIREKRIFFKQSLQRRGNVFKTLVYDDDNDDDYDDDDDDDSCGEGGGVYERQNPLGPVYLPWNPLQYVY